MKRFYRQVAVEPSEAGWRVTLDGRPIKTAQGAEQIVPTQALAQAMADEWASQGDELDPKSFPLRDIADFAIDVASQDNSAAAAGILAYAETDTLCYRADPDEPLFGRQQQLWEPILSAIETRHAVRFERVSGIVHRPQRPETLAALREWLEQQDAFTLAALAMLASLAASLTIALAAIEEDADPRKLWTAANAEEDWQAEQWGWDSVAAENREARLAAFVTAAEFARLARS